VPRNKRNRHGQDDLRHEHAAGRLHDRLAPDPRGTAGPRGLRLHEWAFGSDETNQRWLEAAIAGLGAVICARRTYETSPGGVPTARSDRPGGRYSS